MDTVLRILKAAGDWHHGLHLRIEKAQSARVRGRDGRLRNPDAIPRRLRLVGGSPHTKYSLPHPVTRTFSSLVSCS